MSRVPLRLGIALRSRQQQATSKCSWANAMENQSAVLDGFRTPKSPSDSARGGGANPTGRTFSGVQPKPDEGNGPDSRALLANRCNQGQESASGRFGRGFRLRSASFLRGLRRPALSHPNERCGGIEIPPHPVLFYWDFRLAPLPSGGSGSPSANHQGHCSTQMNGVERWTSEMRTGSPEIRLVAFAVLPARLYQPRGRELLPLW